MVYKSAIIGLGQIGYKLDLDKTRKIIWSHAKAYQVHKNTELVAVCDVNKVNYDSFNKHYPNIFFYNNYHNMMDKNQIDIVSICVPTSEHLEIVKKLINHNIKALFIEKPMGQNIREAEEISTLCKEKNIILAVNYMRRWENKYKVIKKIIDINEFGVLQSITAYGCTALLTSASHLIDLFLFYGGTVEWLIGSLQNNYIRKVHGIDDPGGFAFVKFKNGVFGFLKGVSDNPNNYMFEIDLLFSNGRITSSSDGEVLKIKKFVDNKNSSGQGYKTLEKMSLKKYKVRNNERMVDALSDLIECIEQKKLPKSNPDNALEVHKLIKWVKISSLNDNKKIVYNE